MPPLPCAVAIDDAADDTPLTFDAITLRFDMPPRAMLIIDTPSPRLRRLMLII